MPQRLLVCLGLLLFCFAHPAAADEASVKKALQEKFPKAKVESLIKTPYSGLYEVLMEGNFFYTDEKVTYLFDGNILDARTMQNLTQERIRKLFSVKFTDLPLNLAIKNVKGSGKRKVAIFSDPDCPFCQRLEREMANVTDVTIYTFLYPIDSLHPGASQKAVAIWCSSDRAKAWDDLMLRGLLPSGSAGCDTPIATLQELGRKLKVTGTPTLIFTDGRVIPGAMPAAQLEKFLDASTASPAASR